MEDEKVVDAIIARLNDEESHLAIADMMEALGRIRNPKAIQPIIGTLKSISGNMTETLIRVIENGINALGEIGDPEAVDHITTYFGYGEYIPNFNYGERIQKQAVKAITSIGGDLAFDAMIKLLGAEGRLAKKNALETLVKIGDKRAVKHIIPLLNDDDANVRGCAALTLAKLIER